MTDEVFEIQKQRIVSLADKWLKILGLNSWKIVFKYCRDSAMKVNDEYCQNTVGQCATRWEYMMATIEFNMNQVETLGDDELEKSFLHECCHALVNEMREWCQTERLSEDASAAAMKHEERVVCMLTNSLLNAGRASQ